MNYIKKHKRTVLVVTVLLIMAVLIIRPSTSGEDTTEVLTYTPQVSLYSLLSTKEGGEAFQITGEVVSESRVDTRAQLSEVVRSVYVDIGDTVYAGQTLVQLNNSALVAQKRQLEASVAAEQASLDSILSGTRDEQLAVYIAQKNQAEIAVINANSSLQDKVQDAFTKTDDLIHAQLDIFFDEPLGNQPRLIFSTNDSEATRYLESERVNIEQMFEQWKLFSNTADLSMEEIKLSAESVEADLHYLRTYAGVLAQVVNSLTPSSNISDSTLTAWKTTVSVIRNSINGAITSLVSSKDGLLQAQASLSVAENQLILAQAGATDEQIRIGEARLASAQATLESLLVTLYKTTVTSPISGTVTGVSIEEGNLVSPGQLLVSIVNTSNLSVTAYIGSNDLDAIYLNAPVDIEGAVGHVRAIAPGVNRDTQKVEIAIVFDNLQDTSFVDGQFVNIRILSNNTKREIPLSAVVSVGDISYVYTVSDENSIRAHEVGMGEIVGQKIEILSGLDTVDFIIESARGLEVGQEVAVQK